MLGPGISFPSVRRASLDFASAVRISVRRWCVTVPILLLTITVTVATTRQIRLAYEATATVVLLAPVRGESRADPDDSAPPLVNPYLRFDRNLKVVADLIATILNSPPVVRRLHTVGAAGAYEVSLPVQQSAWQDASPVMRVNASAADPEVARRTVSIVTHYLTVELARRQKAARAPA